MGEKCEACEIIDKIFYEIRPIKSNYDYWLMTELFVYLHNNKCHCNKKYKPETEKEKEDATDSSTEKC